MTRSGVIIGLTWAALIVAMILAAWSLYLRRVRDRMAVRQEALGKMWRPVLLDVLMDAAAPESLWALIRSGDELPLLDFLLEYKRRLNGRDLVRIRELAEPYLPHVANQRSSRTAEKRARAVQTLGELGGSQWTDQVVQALSDPSDFVAMVAATTLARERRWSQVAHVLIHLQRFAHWQGEYLASMLASFGSEAAPAIRAALETSRASEGVRAILVDALARLNDAESAGAAGRILENGAGVELESASLRLLAAVGTEDQLDQATSRLESPEYAVRLNAARAVGHIRGRAQLDQLREIVLNDTSPWVALNAGRALLEAGGRGVLRELAGSQHRRSLVALQILSEGP